MLVQFDILKFIVFVFVKIVVHFSTSELKLHFRLIDVHARYDRIVETDLQVFAKPRRLFFDPHREIAVVCIGAELVPIERRPSAVSFLHPAVIALNRLLRRYGELPVRVTD